MNENPLLDPARKLRIYELLRQQVQKAFDSAEPVRDKAGQVTHYLISEESRFEIVDLLGDLAICESEEED